MSEASEQPPPPAQAQPYSTCTRYSRNCACRTFNSILGNDGNTRCPYVDREPFLQACEASIAYADQRDKYAWSLLLTMGVALLFWLLVLFLMTTRWRRFLHDECERLAHRLMSEKGESGTPASITKQAQDPETGSATEGRFSNVNDALSETNTILNAATGNRDARIALAKQAVKKVHEKTRTRRKGNADTPPPPPNFLQKLFESEWLKLLLFARAEALDLGVQYASFSNPTGTTILEPLLLGGRRCGFRILTPSRLPRSARAILEAPHIPMAKSVRFDPIVGSHTRRVLIRWPLLILSREHSRHLADSIIVN